MDNGSCFKVGSLEQEKELYCPASGCGWKGSTSTSGISKEVVLAQDVESSTFIRVCPKCGARLEALLS